MLEYQFKRVPFNHEKRTLQGTETPAYQDEIRRQAELGWRFVQIVIENTAAVPNEFVLIFERQKEVNG